MKIIIDGKKNSVTFDPVNGHGRLNDEVFEFVPRKDGPEVYHIKWKGKSYNIQILEGDDDTHPRIRVNGNTYNIEIIDKFDELLRALGMENLISSRIQDIKSPMPGLVLEVITAAGTEVKKGEPLLILEAMKMENIIKSPGDGVVKEVLVKPKQAVEKNMLLITFN